MRLKYFLIYGTKGPGLTRPEVVQAASKEKASILAADRGFLRYYVAPTSEKYLRCYYPHLLTSVRNQIDD